MDKELKQVLEELVAKHGAEAIEAASEAIAAKMGLKVPVEHLGVLHPKVIENTVKQLDGCVADILESGDRREKAYKHIGDLRAQIREIDTEIEITEAQAFMDLKYEGKNVYAMLDGVKIPLTNDTMRDAYRKSKTAQLRQERSAVEGEISKLESEINKATQAWETANEASRIVGRKADIQAHLLGYLAK